METLSPRGGRDLPKVTWEQGQSLLHPLPSGLWLLRPLLLPSWARVGGVGSGSLGCQEQISRIQEGRENWARAPPCLKAQHSPKSLRVGHASSGVLGWSAQGIRL